MSKQQTNDETTDLTPGGDAGKPEQYSSFRMDALGVSGSESLIEGPRKRRPSMQIVVLVALIAVAGGALTAMRHLGMGPLSAIAEPVKIDYDHLKAGNADHKKILADLSASHVEQQVPADQVKKNPFRLPDLRPAVAEDDTPKKPVKDLAAEEAARLAKERKDRIESALASIKVHTVLSGTVPVARVGDDNVRVGDTLMGLFTVTAIGGRSVDVIVDGQTYTLSIDDEINGRGPKKKR